MEQACHGSMDNFIPVSSRTMSTIMGKLFIILVNTEKNKFFLASSHKLPNPSTSANYTIHSRGYTDRKKKIIREWNKSNSSPR